MKEVEDYDDVKEVEDYDDVKEVEEYDDVKEVEEYDDVKEVEEYDDVKEVEEYDDVKEVEEYEVMDGDEGETSTNPGVQKDKNDPEEYMDTSGNDTLPLPVVTSQEPPNQTIPSSRHHLMGRVK